MRRRRRPGSRARRVAATADSFDLGFAFMTDAACRGLWNLHVVVVDAYQALPAAGAADTVARLSDLQRRRHQLSGSACPPARVARPAGSPRSVAVRKARDRPARRSRIGPARYRPFGPTPVDINCTPSLDSTIEVPSSKVVVEPMIDPCPAHCIERIGWVALVPQREAGRETRSVPRSCGRSTSPATR